MASGTSLVISYETDGGTTTTHTWKYAKTNATLVNVQALITATIANKTLFRAQPATVKSAKLVTTTETPYDLQSVMTANGEDLRSMIAPPRDGEGDEGGGMEVTTDIPYRSTK